MLSSVKAATWGNMRSGTLNHSVRASAFSLLHIMRDALDENGIKDKDHKVLRSTHDCLASKFHFDALPSVA
jgi:hypothetical protein